MGGSVPMCAWLAEECGVPLDRRQRSGHTALHKAADCGQQDTIVYLLKHLSADKLRRIGLCAEEEMRFAAAEEARAEAEAAGDNVISVAMQDSVPSPAEVATVVVRMTMLLRMCIVAPLPSQLVLGCCWMMHILHGLVVLRLAQSDHYYSRW